MPEPGPVGVNVDPLGEPLGASVFPDGFVLLGPIRPEVVELVELPAVPPVVFPLDEPVVVPVEAVTATAVADVDEFVPSETTTAWNPVAMEGSAKLAATVPSDFTVGLLPTKLPEGTVVAPTLTDTGLVGMNPVPNTVTPVPIAAVVG